ncbi:hypothetical protein [Sandaracinus amylolyticus]|nr:hypothetical protein [Sandaracinus amylolyticus]
MDEKRLSEIEWQAREYEGRRHEGSAMRDAAIELVAEVRQLQLTLAGIANHLRTWATTSAAAAEEDNDGIQAYTRRDVHRCRAATVDDAASFVETRMRALGLPLPFPHASAHFVETRAHHDPAVRTELERNVDFDADGGESVAPAAPAPEGNDARLGADADTARVADVAVGLPHEQTVARGPERVDEERPAFVPMARLVENAIPSPPGEMAVQLMRAVALHGPLTRVALEAWHIEAQGDQRLTVAWLLARGFLEEHAGRVDLRGLAGKTRPVMSDAERHARADAVESAVRAAMIALSAARRPSAALGTLGDLLREGVRGIEAARRADEAKRKGRP